MTFVETELEVHLGYQARDSEKKVRIAIFTEAIQCDRVWLCVQDIGMKVATASEC